MKFDFSLHEQILANLPDGVTIQDRDFKIIYQNEAMRAAFGTHLGKDCFQAYEGREQPCEGCGLQEVFASGKSTLVLRTVPNASGPPSYWENSCYPLFDDSGEIIAGVEVCRDISSRVSLEAEVKEANNSLVKLNREYRTLLDHLPVYIVRYDPKLRPVYVNPAWESAAGLTAAEEVGFSSDQSPKINRPLNEKYQQKLRQVLVTGRSQYCAFEWENAFGQQLYLEFEIIPESGPDNQIASVLAVGRDLTAYRNAENALQQERSLLRCIIDSASDLIFVKDLDGCYRGCNKASETFIDQSEAEQIGKSDFDFFPKEKAEQVQAQDRLVIEEGFPQQSEEWVTYPDGRRVLLDTLKVPFVGPRGEIEGLVGICRDITARKQVEEALCRQQSYSHSLLCLSRRLEYAKTYAEAIAAARDEVRQIVGYTNLWVYLFTEDKQYADILAAEGSVSEDIHSEDHIARLTIAGDPMLEEIVAARDLVVIEDARSDPRTDKEIVARLGNRTIVNVPIPLFDRNLGTIGTGTFGDEGVRLPTGAQRDYLAALASHMAVTLDRIRLLAESKKADEERKSNLRYFESMDQINRAIQGARDPEQMMSTVLEAVLDIFDCDRVYLLYPCDPQAENWRIPMERTRPEYPGGSDSAHQFPMDSDIAETFQRLLKAEGPIKFGPGTNNALPGEISETFNIQSFMAMAIHPKIDKPWQFGVHQCSHVRMWSADEERLFEAIGRRLADGLTSLLSYRDLHESREFLDNIVESLPNMLFVKDASTLNFVRFNKAGEKLLGYRRDELLGKNDYDFFPAEVADFFTANDRLVLASQQSVDIPEERIRLRNGEERILHTQKIPLLDKDNRPQYLLGISEDITERKHLEEQLLHSQKMESIGALAGGVAHDFNNMLAVILGRTQLALRKVGAEEPLHANLQEIHKAAERSVVLTKQLLAFARKQIISLQIIDLNGALQGMLSMLRRLIGEDVELCWEPGSKNLQVNMDPSQIDQILVNLCVNARDAIEGVGKISISTCATSVDESFCSQHAESLPGDYAVLRVSDTGRGMEKEILDKIFEPFFTTKKSGQGTGLGLSTVYGIARQNRGFILVDSTPGAGTSVCLYLPRMCERPLPAAEEVREESLPGGDETILLVEDEIGLLSMTRQMLEDSGYRVLAAGGPAEALLIAQETADKIDLLLTDVVMPGMNGQVLARKLAEISPETSCLYMSGYPSNVIAENDLMASQIHLIPKPFSVEGLLLKVRLVLDERRKGEQGAT